VREYDAAKGPAIFRDRQWPKPTRSPLAMSFAEADALPEYLELREPQLFKQRDLVATIQPGYLTRDQIVTLRLIKDSYPERSIFFSTGGYGKTLGLANHSLRQGLVEKLVEKPIVPGRDTVQVGDGFLDVNRSYALWTQVYKGPQELIDEGDWVDRPSFGIPYTYTVTGYLVAEALRLQGREALGVPIMNTVKGMAQAARITDVLGALSDR